MPDATRDPLSLSPEAAPARPGYHLRAISKGELGELSKVREELEELEDAMAQGSRVMALVELADLIGAVEHFMARHLPGFTLEDLVAFSAITQRAFRNGRRTGQS